MPEHQIRRPREDQRLLTGQGEYTSGHEFPAQVHGHFPRADLAYDKIVRIGILEAQKLPGVIDIVTGAVMAATEWMGTPAIASFMGVGGSSPRVPFRTGLQSSACALSESR